VGVAGAAVAHIVTNKPVRSIPFIGPALTSASNSTFLMCFEDTSYNQYGTSDFGDGDGDGDIDIDNKHHNSTPGSFFLWFTAQNLAPGTYSITVDAPVGGFGDSTSPFAVASNGNGNNAFLYNLADNQSSKCPTSDPSGQFAQAHTVPDLFTSGGVTIPQSGSSFSDLQLKVHLTWNDPNDITTPLPTSLTCTLHSGGTGGPVVGQQTIIVTADSSD
jgi:hypothetical protein